MDKFWPKVNKTDSCWLWAGYSPNGRYGALYVARKRVLAHRFSYEIHKGPIAANLEVCHTCDVTLCVNPSHLVLGTHSDNMLDMHRKQRAVRRRGEMNGHNKIPESIAKSIRDGSIDIQQFDELAAQLNCTRAALMAIKRNTVWKHLNATTSTTRTIG